MKRVEYFNTKEELERYYENGVPSTVLAIVQPDAETAAVLYTSSNNSPINPGQTEEQGGEGQTIDPWWGEGLALNVAIQEDTFPVTADLYYSSIQSDFAVETENDEVTSASWNEFINVEGTDYTIKVVVDGDSNLHGEPTGELNGMAEFYADQLDSYSDLYEDIYPRLVDVTMTKSADPRTDGYDYLVEGKLYTWNRHGLDSEVQEITENGFYPVESQMGFNVNIKSGGSTGTLLTEVFGADENDERVNIRFKETADSFTYGFDCTWDGENWTGSLSNAGFALVGRMGKATQYDYDDQTGKMVEHNSYTAIQMHIANGALYLGDVFAETGKSLYDDYGEYAIAVDMWSNTKFLNNGFGAGPENLDMTGWASGTLTFILTVPKNLPVNYDTGYDYIGDGEVREIEHPCVYLKWEWRGVQER